MNSVEQAIERMKLHPLYLNAARVMAENRANKQFYTDDEICVLLDVSNIRKGFSFFQLFYTLKKDYSIDLIRLKVDGHKGYKIASDSEKINIVCKKRQERIIGHLNRQLDTIVSVDVNNLSLDESIKHDRYLIKVGILKLINQKPLTSFTKQSLVNSSTPRLIGNDDNELV